MKRQPLLLVVVGLCLAMAALDAARLVFASASIYSGALNDRTLLLAGGLVKLLALVVAAVYAFRSGVLLGPGSDVPWLLLTGGLVALALGQATLVGYHVILGRSPFPSIADIFFVVAYPLLISGAIAYIAIYARSGFPMEGAGTTFLMFSLAASAAAWLLLHPIVRSRDALLPKTLYVIYPVLDLVLLIPVMMLLRITSRFRDGATWRTWLALLAGFVFTAAGHILFAYVSALGHRWLDPVVHATYLVAYGGLAAAAMMQRSLLTA